MPKKMTPVETCLNRLTQYARLMRIDRPIGTLLLLWPALWALWVAGDGRPNAHVVIVIVAGVIVMRAAGCVINDYADRRFDPHVSRTRNRPIAAGKVSPNEALSVFVALIVMAFLLVLELNAMTVLMSVVGALLAVIYPYMKRYTYFPQLYLGLAFGWAVPMSFTALTESVPKVAWVMYLATIIWALIYDTIYAMMDREDDLRIGVKSTAVLFADMDLIIIGILQVVFVAALAMVGIQVKMSAPYFISLAIVGLLFVYQQWCIRDRGREGCMKGFRNNNWVGIVVFCGIAAHYHLANPS